MLFQNFGGLGSTLLEPNKSLVNPVLERTKYYNQFYRKAVALSKEFEDSWAARQIIDLYEEVLEDVEEMEKTK